MTYRTSLTVILQTLVLANTLVDAQIPEKHLPGSTLAGVTPGPDGRLYGVTYGISGTNTRGSIYSVDAAVGAVVTHYNFPGGVTGGSPSDEMTFDPGSGKFYGTTLEGGAGLPGTIFSYVPGANSIVTVRSG